MDPATLALFMQLMGMAGGGMGGGGAAGAAGSAGGKSGTSGWAPGLAFHSPAFTESEWGKPIMSGLRKYTLPGKLGAFGSEEEEPSPMDIFKKMMKKQYPYVSQSEDELARTAIRETSRGAGAAGMGNSAVLQSIRDAAVRQANENKASARGQFLQQAFDVAGASQKAQAFNTMMQTAQGAGGAGGSQMTEWLKMLLQQLGLGGGEGMATAATPEGARWRAAGL